jgi:UDP-N-acetylglucosamine 2-epimerase (non-hydrolysing)
LKVVLPLHPRTRSRFQQFDLLDDLIAAGIGVLEPQSYFDFLALMDNAAVVLTDSGGIQEETTALGVPCMTFRENTERPITITEGTNQLVGTDPARVREALDETLQHPKSGRIPELWDGHAGERIVTVIAAQRRSDGASVSEAFGSSASGAAATWQT